MAAEWERTGRVWSAEAGCRSGERDGEWETAVLCTAREEEIPSSELGRQSCELWKGNCYCTSSFRYMQIFQLLRTKNFRDPARASCLYGSPSFLLPQLYNKFSSTMFNCPFLSFHFYHLFLFHFSTLLQNILVGMAHLNSMINAGIFINSTAVQKMSHDIVKI
jgi:hypothetical protein